MNNPLLVLVLGLAGAGVVLTALLTGLTGRSARRRGWAAWLTTPGLLTLGGALIVGAWLLQRAATPPQDINRLLAQSPAAAGTRPAAPRFDNIGVWVDGTPSDRAKASPSERNTYSNRLATALAQAVVAAGISTKADGQALLPAQIWADGEAMQRCQGYDLLVTVRLPAVRLPNREDYALWREPNFELRWCRSGTVQSSQYRVLERPGDTVPYEQAVRDRLLSLLRRTPRA